MVKLEVVNDSHDISIPVSVYIEYLYQLLERNIKEENYEECAIIKELLSKHGSK